MKWFDKLSINDLFKIIWFGNDQKMKMLYSQLKINIIMQNKILLERFEDKVLKIRSGDDLLPSVMKMVKVFVALKED